MCSIVNLYTSLVASVLKFNAFSRTVIAKDLSYCLMLGYTATVKGSSYLLLMLLIITAALAHSYYGVTELEITI